MTDRTLRPDTLAVRGGLHRSNFEETAEALYLTSGYVYESAGSAEAAFKGDIDRFVYSRYGNPTVATFQERLRLIEGTEACFATASGMAAVFNALLAVVKSGDRIVAARSLFGSCFVILDEILPRYGVTTEFVDGGDLDAVGEGAVDPGGRGVLRDPVQPDDGARRHPRRSATWRMRPGAKVVLDNVFATPVLQRGADFGADIIVYSATKHIDGQGRVLGGAILGTAGVHRRSGAGPDAPHRPVDEPVQRLGAGQGPGDDEHAGPGDERLGAEGRDVHGAARPACAG